MPMDLKTILPSGQKLIGQGLVYVQVKENQWTQSSTEPRVQTDEHMNQIVNWSALQLGTNTVMQNTTKGLVWLEYQEQECFLIA